MQNFEARHALLRESLFSLPFTIGSANQKGANTEHNNQDSVSIIAEKDILVAVVCDGCSGASSLGKNKTSINEVGAHIQSALAVRLLYDKVKETESVIGLDKYLTDALLTAYRTILEVLVGHNATDREHLLREMLMATLIAVVITKESWIVLHCGDGMYAVNDVFEELDDHSGVYLTGSLSVISKNGGSDDRFDIRKIAEGQSSGLNNLLIASDGICDYDECGGLPDMLSNLDENRTYTRGYDGAMGFIREFRLRVAYMAQEVTNMNTHDDRTLVMIRRIPEIPEATGKIEQLDTFHTTTMITPDTAISKEVQYDKHLA